MKKLVRFLSLLMGLAVLTASPVLRENPCTGFLYTVRKT